MKNCIPTLIISSLNYLEEHCYHMAFVCHITFLYHSDNILILPELFWKRISCQKLHHIGPLVMDCKIERDGAIFIRICSVRSVIDQDHGNFPATRSCGTVHGCPAVPVC